MIEVRPARGAIEQRSGIEFLRPGEVFRFVMNGAPSPWLRADSEPEWVERPEYNRSMWQIKISEIPI